MTGTKLKGIWIPAGILLNEDLSDKEKLILAMILYLSEETASCFASNKYIANIVNVTQERVSKIVSSLRDKGYIEVKLNYKLQSKEIENRQITPIKENINGYSEKDIYTNNENNYLDSEKEQAPIGENNKEIINNKKYKNNYNNQNYNQTKYTPYRNEGTDKAMENFNWNSLYANLKGTNST